MHRVARRILVGMVLLFTLFLGVLLIGYRMHRGLIRQGSSELSDVLSRWDKAGRPQGELLAEFMKKAYRGTIVSNQSLTVDGTNYFTQFATTRLGFPGILFITTNRAIILINKDSEPELISYP
jgi:hypothetical protein